MTLKNGLLLAIGISGLTLFVLTEKVRQRNRLYEKKLRAKEINVWESEGGHFPTKIPTAKNSEAH